MCYRELDLCFENGFCVMNVTIAVLSPPTFVLEIRIKFSLTTTAFDDNN